ncbi:unnamed protein product, partial [Brachionus calyciflorus]
MEKTRQYNVAETIEPRPMTSKQASLLVTISNEGDEDGGQVGMKGSPETKKTGRPPKRTKTEGRSVVEVESLVGLSSGSVSKTEPALRNTSIHLVKFSICVFNGEESDDFDRWFDENESKTPNIQKESTKLFKSFMSGKARSFMDGLLADDLPFDEMVDGMRRIFTLAIDNKNKLNTEEIKVYSLSTPTENSSEITEDLKNKIESERHNSWQQILTMTFPEVRKKAYRNDAAIRIYISFFERSNKTARSEKSTEERNKEIDYRVEPSAPYKTSSSEYVPTPININPNRTQTNELLINNSDLRYSNKTITKEMDTDHLNNGKYYKNTPKLSDFTNIKPDSTLELVKFVAELASKGKNKINKEYWIRAQLAPLKHRENMAFENFVNKFYMLTNMTPFMAEEEKLFHFREGLREQTKKE